MFSKFAEERAFMLECNISYIANWWFSSEYMAIAQATESYSDCTQEMKKLRVVQYLNSGNYVSFSSWDQDQIGIKLWTNHVIYLKLARST